MAYSLDLSIGGIVVAVTYILTSGYVRLAEAPLLAACLIFGMGIGAANGLPDRASQGVIGHRHPRGGDVLYGIVIALVSARPETRLSS